MQDSIVLYVSVPVASFRTPRAREFFETLPCPPPSTVYGMLLSLVGETNRHAHEGAELAIAMVAKPEYSVVLRTLWRVKSRKYGLGQGENKRPDFQELLTGIRLAVWVRPGRGENGPTLYERVRAAFANPASVGRFGGLSLGESTHLVDEVRPFRRNDATSGRLLVARRDGDMSLPVWPDHVGSAGTRWEQFRLEEAPIGGVPPDDAWVTIERPGTMLPE